MSAASFDVAFGDLDLFTLDSQLTNAKCPFRDNAICRIS
jgi:hypothetical protein